MVGRRLRPAIFMVALPTVSCSLFTDLGGLSDARTQGAEDLDASPGKPSADGDVVREAGSGGDGARPEAGGGRLCDARSGSRFCTDFDGPGAASLPFRRDNATVTLTNATSVSSPTAMLVELDTPPTDYGQGGLDLNLGPTGPNVRITLDMRISAHSSDYTESLAVRSVAGPSTCEIFLVLATDSFALGYGCPADKTLPLGKIAFDEWLHVDVAVDATAGKATIGVGQTQTELAVPQRFANGDLNVFAGVYYAKDSSGPVRVAVDNVIVQ